MTLIVEWMFLVLWIAGPAASEWHHRLQPLVWVPDWVWLAAVAPLGLAVGYGAMGRPGSVGRRSLSTIAAILPVLIVLDGVLERDWRPWGVAPADQSGRLVFVNANHPPREMAGDVIESILALEPEVVVVTNPGWLASAWRTWEGGSLA